MEREGSEGEGQAVERCKDGGEGVEEEIVS